MMDFVNCPTRPGYATRKPRLAGNVDALRGGDLDADVQVNKVIRAALVGSRQRDGLRGIASDGNPDQVDAAD